MELFDCIVVGGGASGLTAALEAAKSGASVCILEKQSRVGKKLLSTGNGRCNFTHRPILHTAFHGEQALAAQVLMACPDAVEWFHSLGVLERVDREGRVYPFSNQASAVLDALRFGCAQNNVKMRCDYPVREFTRQRGIFRISGENEALGARQLVLACGGMAAPALGCQGDAFALLKPYGIAVEPPRPALCPVPCRDPVLRALKGLRVQAAVSAWKKHQLLRTTLGEVQFQEQALSGICVFDLAELVPEELSLNLLPDLDAQQVETLLWYLLRTRKQVPLEEWLTGILPKRVAVVLLKAAGISPGVLASALLPKQLHRLAALLQDWRFAVTPPVSFTSAQVTAGGIPARELTETLELRRLPGCFVCGEAVNVHADCGGYNLSWAWASGRVVGNEVARRTLAAHASRRG